MLAGVTVVDMTHRPLVPVPTGHCGLRRRHIAHRFWDPTTRAVYACAGLGLLPVGFQGTRRDPAHAPQLRHASEAPLT